MSLRLRFQKCMYPGEVSKRKMSKHVDRREDVIVGVVDDEINERQKSW